MNWRRSRALAGVLGVAMILSPAEESATCQTVFPLRLDGQTYAEEGVVAMPAGSGEILDPKIVSVASDSGSCAETLVQKEALLARCDDDDGCALRMVTRIEGKPLPQPAATLAFDTERRWRSLVRFDNSAFVRFAGQVDNGVEEPVLEFNYGWFCDLKDDHLFQGPRFSTIAFSLRACGGNTSEGFTEVACTLRIED